MNVSHNLWGGRWVCFSSCCDWTAFTTVDILDGKEAVERDLFFLFDGHSCALSRITYDARVPPEYEYFTCTNVLSVLSGRVLMEVLRTRILKSYY